MPVPSTSEQSSIVRLAASVDVKIDALTEMMHSQRQLKRSLMGDLLTGKIRVKNLDLEKILT